MSGVSRTTACSGVRSGRFFSSKAGLVWKFFPEGAQKSQTVLKPKAEGQSESFGLLKERISRLDPTWAGRMTF